MYTGVWKKDRKKTTICCRSVFPCMNLSLSKIYISKHHKSKRYKKLMIMLTKLYALRTDVTKYKPSYRLQWFVFCRFVERRGYWYSYRNTVTLDQNHRLYFVVFIPNRVVLHFSWAAYVDFLILIPRTD